MENEKQPLKKSDIKIEVALNQDKHPVSINWHAEDAGLEKVREAKSMMLALWDKEEKSTMRIDLWTIEMSVEEMQFFFYETLASMADTYERATNDKINGTELREYARRFGKNVNVLK